jgi:AcrR family transcriptional regulator
VGGSGRDLFAEVTLLEPPPPSASACLDAAARCILRSGLASTSVPDVARELGVSRGTVYRQVGPMAVVVRQLLRRELGRVLAEAAEAAGPDLDPARVVRLVEAVVVGTRLNPVLRQVLTDELAVVGVGLLESLPRNVLAISSRLAPALGAAMDRGHLARRDPEVVAEWLVRVGFTLALAPPPRPEAEFLAEVLLPLLEP